MFALALLLAPNPAPAPSPRPIDFEAKCADGSVLKLRVLDEKIGLVTKYGTVQVPFTDIKRIEFSMRLPLEVEAKINSAVAKLNHDDSITREAATDELKAYKERAFYSVLKVAKCSDPEVCRRAAEILKAIPANTWPDADIIVTEDSRFVGKLVVDSVKVNTTMFGDQNLRFAEIKQLASSGGGSLSLATPVPGPTNLSEYANQFGKEFAFTVIGAQAGAIWGSGPYSLDSVLGAAAIHAGLVLPGQSATVYVRIVASPQQFVGSAQNGVSSSPYGVYPSGAYEFIRK